MLNSYHKELCQVQLPYKARQSYMHSFDIESPVMEEGFEDYFAPVTELLKSAGITSGKAHMTVDEKIINAGCSQRRPGPHVDGCFLPEAMAWGNGGWNHTCNNIPDRMAVIIASSVVGCRVWDGQFDGSPKDDGDLSHLDLDEGKVLVANTGFYLSKDCVHESMIQSKPIKRTFLRIAFHD